MSKQVVLFILHLSLVSVRVRSQSEESKQLKGYRKKPKIWTVVDCNALNGLDGSRTPMECTGEEFQACLKGHGDDSEDDGIMETLKCTNSSQCRNINCEDAVGNNDPEQCSATQIFRARIYPNTATLRR